MAQQLCEHEELTNNAPFFGYHYCLSCEYRIHVVMRGFEVIRFQSCLEKHKAPQDLYSKELRCNCESKIQLKQGERLD